MKVCSETDSVEARKKNWIRQTYADSHTGQFYRAGAPFFGQSHPVGKYFQFLI